MPIIALAGSSLNMSRTQGDAEAKLRIKRSIQTLQYALYLGAVVFVAAVVEFHAFQHWLLTGVAETSLERATAAANMGVAVNGGIYALLLGAVFLPAYFLLHQRARRLAQQAVPNSTPREQDKWIEEEGLSPSLHRHLGNILALLSPLLAGSPLSGLLSHL